MVIDAEYSLFDFAYLENMNNDYKKDKKPKFVFVRKTKMIKITDSKAESYLFFFIEI